MAKPLSVQKIVIPRIGDPSVLSLQEAPDPEPGPDEVRIRVEAAGVNFADLMARIGVYQDAPELPAVVGYEVAGSIDAVGEGVDPSRMGEPVVSPTQFGGYASSVVVDNMQAILRPEGLDARTAASIPVTGLTAWMMLIEMGRIREGDRVLVHSAGGGVGLMALDIIRWKKAIAVGTASSHKHEELLERGYSQLVDYRNQDFEAVLKDGEPFDLALDPVGGPSWAKSFSLLRTGGRLICFGFSAHAGEKRNILKTASSLINTPWLLFNPIRVINENKGAMGVNMGRMWQEKERLSLWLAQLMDLWSQGVLRPRVHAAVPFSNAKEAHRILHDRENVGKVVLVPDAFA